MSRLRAAAAPLAVGAVPRGSGCGSDEGQPANATPTSEPARARPTEAARGRAASRPRRGIRGEPRPRVRCRPDNHRRSEESSCAARCCWSPSCSRSSRRRPRSRGGFATVGLSSTPAGLAPGQPWTVDITVLAHGRTPVEGLPATVRIRSGDAVKEFPTKETGKPGVYRANVVFPASGVWSYEVVDGYIQQVHTFPQVKITGEPVSPRRSPPGRRHRRRDRGRLAVGRRSGAGARARRARVRPPAPHPAGALKTA